jgi:hypothetical protein
VAGPEPLQEITASTAHVEQAGGGVAGGLEERSLDPLEELEIRMVEPALMGFIEIGVVIRLLCIFWEFRERVFAGTAPEQMHLCIQLFSAGFAYGADGAVNFFHGLSNEA